MEEPEDPLIANLRRLATAVHAAILLMNPDESLEKLKSFPKESCNLACGLLRGYLFQNGYSEILLMSGDRPDGLEQPLAGHLWIRVHEVDIDITLYQFDESLPEVIVQKNSPYHAELNPRVLRADSADTLAKCISRIRSRYNDWFNGLFDDVVFWADEILKKLDSADLN